MNTITPKTEYPPILPVGFHLMTIDELRSICVDCFPESTTRKSIMDGLEGIINRLIELNIDVEIWVNGSFLTKKCDPQDSDIVLRIPIEIYENGTDEQKAVLDWIKSNQKKDFHCDSYVFYVFPSNDERAVYNDYNIAYWLKQFGFSRGEEIKGIAVLRTGGVE